MHLARPKNQAEFWRSFVEPVKKLYPHQYWNNVPAARAAAKRGEAFLKTQRGAPRWSIDLNEGRPPVWTLGLLPNLKTREHCARIAALRDELEK